VAIAETPVEPHVPSKPNVPLNMALGAMLAAILSLGGAFAADYFLDTVEQPRELEELTGLPVLATSFGD
jgi:capsular polysaccharide biosynthesis protein